MITNSWVRYVDRSFLSIKNSVINRLRVVVPEMTDYSPSNLMMILVDIFAGVAEMLNYYIDTTARELFLPTARRLSSVLKIAEMAGYLGKARVPAQASVEFYFSDGEVCSEGFIIPADTILNSNNGVRWVLKENAVFRKGLYKVVGYVEQTGLETDVNIGTSNGLPNQAFPLPVNYAHGSLSVSVGGEIWGLVSSLGFSKPTSKHFVVGLKHDGSMYLVFGDGVNGAIPTDGVSILASYKTTEGLAGMTAENTITTIISALSTPPGNSTLLVNNPNPSFGAKNIEGIEDVRKAVPISIRTLERAVTRQDYVDVATLAPGVRSAVLSFDCGLGVNLYIVPNSGGVPNALFLSEVEDYVKERSIASIPVTCKPSGETRVKLKMTVVARYRMNPTVVRDKVKRALAFMYDPNKTWINQSIRKSDIIAVVDNLPEVDYLNLDYIYALPYLRPSNLDINLNYSVEIKPDSIKTFSWKLVYSASNDFTLFKEGVQAGINLGVGTHDLGIMALSILSLPSGASAGDYWEFKTYPYNSDIVLTDYSVPVIYGEEDITLEVKEQYV